MRPIASMGTRTHARTRDESDDSSGPKRRVYGWEGSQNEMRCACVLRTHHERRILFGFDGIHIRARIDESLGDVLVPCAARKVEGRAPLAVPFVEGNADRNEVLRGLEVPKLGGVEDVVHLDLAGRTATRGGACVALRSGCPACAAHLLG